MFLVLYLGSYGMGILDSVVDKILKEYGITDEHINKVKQVLDFIDVKQDGDKTIVEITLKKISITLDK